MAAFQCCGNKHWFDGEKWREVDERIDDALEIDECYELCVTEVAIIGGCFKKPKKESMRMQQCVIA